VTTESYPGPVGVGIAKARRGTVEGRRGGGVARRKEKVSVSVFFEKPKRLVKTCKTSVGSILFLKVSNHASVYVNPENSLAASPNALAEASASSGSGLMTPPGPMRHALSVTGAISSTSCETTTTALSFRNSDKS
jgi:hypothetical protein